MAGVGDLVAHLGLDNSGFKKGLSSSRSMLSTFAKGIAAVAGAAGIGLLVRRSFESVDSLSELGGTLGKTAAEMAGWSHAAKLSGLSMEDMTAGIRRLQKEGVDLFRLADQIAAIRDPAEQARRAMDVLGKSGGKFLPLLQGGSQAIREMVAEGSKLSGLEGLDASQVEAANDQIDRAKLAFEGIGNILAVTIAPGVQWAATQMKDFALMIQQGSSLFVDLGQFALDSFTVIGFGIENMDSLAEMAWLNLQLGAVKAWETVKHLFSVQIPTVVSFMVDNAGRMMIDGFGGAVEKLADNMANAFAEVADFITSWGEDPIEFNWEPVGEGFASVMDEMPEIADRPITELERELGGRIGQFGEQLNDGLGQTMLDSNREQLGQNKPGAGLDLPELAAAKQPELKAAFKGSQDAASIMLRGVGGKTMEQIAQKSLNVQQQTLVAVKANKPPTLTPVTLGT